MEQKIKKPAACLPEKEKMEALGRLSCKVAHDFNNILGAIEGYASLCLNGVKKEDPLAQDLLEIRALVAKGAGLGKQLLVFGGRQLLNRVPCGVNALIERTLERPEFAPSGNFKMETRLEPGLPGIIADAAQLEQALANLLLNAREAMTGGGTAVVSSTSERLEAGADPHGAGGLFVKISIRDTGPGLRPEVLQHLFEPLFSTTKRGLGTGLGLSFVYGVAKQHGGWAEARNGPGGGSEFSLFLPAGEAR